MPVKMRRGMAAVALTAVAIAGWQISTHGQVELGVIGLPGATADPTGPPGPGGMTGGPGGMNGGQFVPPSMAGQMPDYQGGQPALDQNGGVNIYNSGAPQAPQAGQQQPGAQQAGSQQPANGTQPPNYTSPFTFNQQPQPNPEQQPQPNNQPQQGQQQQPSQAPTQTQQPQNKQDDTTQQLDQQQGKTEQDQQDRSEEMQRCINSALTSAVGGGGGMVGGQIVPGQDPIFQADGSCSNCDTEKPRQYNRNCEDYKYLVPAEKPLNAPCSYTYDPESKVTPEDKNARHDYCTYSPDTPGYGGFDFSFACARHDMCYDIADSKGDGYNPCNGMLRKDLRKVCEPIGGWEGFRCNRLADVYWLGVTGGHLLHL